MSRTTQQDYAKGLVAAFRRICNALAHGDVMLKPNVSWEFLAVRDLINQLFPVRRVMSDR